MVEDTIVLHGMEPSALSEQTSLVFSIKKEASPWEGGGGR